MLLSIGADFLKVLAQSCATLFVVGCWLLIVDCCGKLVDCRMEEDHRSVHRQSFPRKSDHLIFRGYWNKKYIAAKMNVLHLQLGAINSICFICTQTPPQKKSYLLAIAENGALFPPSNNCPLYWIMLCVYFLVGGKRTNLTQIVFEMRY